MTDFTNESHKKKARGKQSVESAHFSGVGRLPRLLSFRPPLPLAMLRVRPPLTLSGWWPFFSLCSSGRNIRHPTSNLFFQAPIFFAGNLNIVVAGR